MEKDFSVEDALERILAACQPLETIEVDSSAAHGEVLARDVIAPHALPPFANSGMDGFAVRVADLAEASHERPVTLPVAGVVQAGGTTVAVRTGTAVRIMTGAPLPEGAEAVVPIENVEATETHATFFELTKAGRHTRPAGEDVAEGAVAIPAGRLLRAAEIGLLAALGVNPVHVIRRPRVAIISTGDELVPAFDPAPLPPGKIRDANGPALVAFVAEQGAQPLPLGVAHDTHAALRAKLDEALQQGADLILTSAGASAGDYDVVSGLMRAEDALEVWRVNLKPGRPLLFGRVGGGAQRATPLLGLPGNPASALIVAELFVKPAIARMRGLPHEQRVIVRARLAEPQRGSERRHYVRAWVERDADGYHATTRGIGSGSGSLSTLVKSNALLIIPENTGELPAGSVVDAMLL
jgi:molybdopterin molybdotransferase